MPSIFENSSESDDSDYEPAVELFSEKEKIFMLNHKENTKAKIRTRNCQDLSETDLNLDFKLKDIEKSDVSSVESKNQADNVYKSFLKEATAEMKLLENKCFPSGTVLSEVSASSFVDVGCSKESRSFNVNIPKEVNETAKNISSLSYNFKDSKSDLTKNCISNSEKNSTTLSPISSMKRRDLRSVMGNVLKKRKKETILSMSMQDWQKYKLEEDITDDLKTYNQGKKGYLVRKRFLEKSDLRQFEIEREMRLSKKQT